LLLCVSNYVLVVFDLLLDLVLSLWYLFAFGEFFCFLHFVDLFIVFVFSRGHAKVSCWDISAFVVP
jgi:hypothetical protein